MAGSTAFAFALLVLFVTRSLPAAALLFLAGLGCALAVLLAVERSERRATLLPDGAYWAGLATVDIADLTRCPLLDTVKVRSPDRTRRGARRGASGRLVVDQDGLRWTANWNMHVRGVSGWFELPWSAIVNARAVPVPAATPGCGGVALLFADANKLDVAFIGTYPSFRAALTRAPIAVPGLSD